ncbi:MAG: hypothetical protein K1000chlam2_00092 [Chlamydiae bacterium]|nr:hypothetical protein [Chlamydiota bacterium]
MKNLLFLLFLFNLLSFKLLSEEDIDVTQEIRIKQLIPQDLFTFFLAIEPAIPEDFVCLRTDKDPIWIYWGPEEVLRAFFEDEKSLSQPIIRASIGLNTVQDSPEGFNRQRLRAECKKAAPDMYLYFGNWGSYPYFTSTGTIDGQKVHCAWVGLNTDGTTLQFHLVIPENKGLEKEAVVLWNRFLKETQELPEPLLFKAHGQEMHIGYTIVDICGHKAKVIAEKRKSDQKLQYAVIPLDSNLKFKFEDALSTNMQAKWHANEPLLKLTGTFTIEDNRNISWEQTTSILIKETDKFTKIPPQKENVYIGSK